MLDLVNIPGVGAEAIAETVELGVGIGRFRVKVTSNAYPFTGTYRVYELNAPDEDTAARHCIGVFVREMKQRLLSSWPR